LSVKAIFEDYAAVLQIISQLSEKETAAYGLLKVIFNEIIENRKFGVKTLY